MRTCNFNPSRENVLSFGSAPYGLFSGLLPAVAQTEGGELQWGRSRQALVPDFRIQLPTPEGPTFSLAELKICGAGKTWCLRGQEGRRKYRRAAGLIKLY